VVDSTLAKLNVPATALFSTLGRTAASGLETLLVIEWAMEFYEQLLTNIRNGDSRMANMEKFDPKTLGAKEHRGVGHTEAPAAPWPTGSSSKDKKIKNYQMVVPTPGTHRPAIRKARCRPTSHP
jgi:hydrogenase large subunit